MEVLPDWLRAVGALIPLTYALHAARAALLGGAGAGPSVGTVAVLAAFAVAALAVGGVAFRWALARAKRDGTLSQY